MCYRRMFHTLMLAGALFLISTTVASAGQSSMTVEFSNKTGTSMVVINLLAACTSHGSWTAQQSLPPNGTYSFTMGSCAKQDGILQIRLTDLTTVPSKSSKSACAIICGSNGECSLTGRSMSRAVTIKKGTNGKLCADCGDGRCIGF